MRLVRILWSYLVRKEGLHRTLLRSPERSLSQEELVEPISLERVKERVVNNKSSGTVVENRRKTNEGIPDRENDLACEILPDPRS